MRTFRVASGVGLLSTFNLQLRCMQCAMLGHPLVTGKGPVCELRASNSGLPVKLRRLSCPATWFCPRSVPTLPEGAPKSSHENRSSMGETILGRVAKRQASLDIAYDQQVCTPRETRPRRSRGVLGPSSAENRPENSRPDCLQVPSSLNVLRLRAPDSWQLSLKGK